MSSSARLIWCLFTALFAILNFIAKSLSLEFSYTNFLEEDSSKFSFSNGSGFSNDTIQITPSHGGELFRSGRVLYNETFKLRRSNGTVLTSINTTFVFNTQPQTQPAGEGLAFILTNNPALPSNSSGQWLGIVNNQTDNETSNHIVAVEFDTRKSYAEDLDDNHLGLDVNGIKSIQQYSFTGLSINISAGLDILVNLVFNGTTKSLSILGAMLNNTEQQTYVISLSWHIDLSLYLSEDVWVGFAGSTSNFSQLNQIKSWDFSTIEEDGIGIGIGSQRKQSRTMLFLTLLLLLPVSAVVSLILRKNRSMLRYREKLEKHDNLELIIEDFTKRPVRFQLKELKSATANFDSSRELGKGGSGIVYRGYLKDVDLQVAVKRLSIGEKKGERQFITEVTTISQLSHRHLVKLIGWCHEEDELLLVCEFLPKGSLDNFIFGKGTQKPVLNWERRHKIICGVASALDYLHHGSIKRVLHRDVKASNVMLDEEFDAKLGDFGLARVIQQDSKTHHSTVALAGTQGYMAPECYFTGRASSETDVFGFGVFTMEVACGRRPAGNGVLFHNGDDDENVEDYEGGMGYIVDWLWDLYGRGKVLDAADPRLCGEYDEEQMNCVLSLALACCHPNPKRRPSMRMALQILSGGAQPPNLPVDKPSFVWPPINTQYGLELPTVGLLFAGGVQTQSIIGGR